MWFGQKIAKLWSKVCYTEISLKKQVWNVELLLKYWYISYRKKTIANEINVCIHSRILMWCVMASRICNKSIDDHNKEYITLYSQYGVHCAQGFKTRYILFCKHLKTKYSISYLSLNIKKIRKPRAISIFTL